MRRLFFGLCVLFLLVACDEATPVPPVTPPGWQVIAEPQGLCQFAVPPSFKVTEPGKVEDASAKIFASLSAHKYEKNTSDWSAYKTSVKKLAKPVKMIEDSATLLYYDTAIATFKTSAFWIAKPARGYVCIAQVAVPKADAEKQSATLKQIVDSVGVKSK